MNKNLIQYTILFIKYYIYTTVYRGVDRIFQIRGVTLCLREGTHQVFMASSPPDAGSVCSKKAYKVGGGGGEGYGHPRTPSWLRP